MRIGLDVGSTTLKCVVIDDEDCIVYRKYIRHLSQIAQKAYEILQDAVKSVPEAETACVCISGSAGMGMAESLEIPFTQEVHATRQAVRRLMPETDTVIELGGEDAKILFLTGSVEVRMNGSCAGGTGAFIDQMSTLLGVTPEEMNSLAQNREKVHSIASRCGVFAKSDIQSLLNQGASREDIAASIFYAVVSQTVAGLAQGREISGNVLYLGGPMTFFPELRNAFDDVLSVSGYCPEDSLYYVALGAALTPDLKVFDVLALAGNIRSFASKSGYRQCQPLFKDVEDYQAFVRRHGRSTVKTDGVLLEGNRGFIGIDAGSTTVKCVGVNDRGDIIFTRYIPNSGNPVPLVKGFLTEIYEKFPHINIISSACTGYGEEIIKNAFRLDCGVVETIAHFTAAKAFEPEVDFIIDIGGQDIKCFQIRNKVIDNIFLNEACSSGCGSFLQAFAGALGYDTYEFSSMGLFAEHPVDLGSRCTVFMNSAVKQAQKDGADLGSISAGLSMSVVKNALYKVIRSARPSELGSHIVVQGGTFLNDAVLRSFEQEIGRKVTRPSISGLMGAYGAALYAMENAQGKGGEIKSSIVNAAELKRFRHEVERTSCTGCGNNCALTVNHFDGGRRFIAGNRCERPVTGKRPEKQLNMYEYKRRMLKRYKPVPGVRGKIGLPMGLNMFEMLPFWHAFFTKLGFEVIVSPKSTRDLYYKGQHSIPSDTVCYPAKLVHGHVEHLMDMDADAVFYPCQTYNFDEGQGDNCYNCPVVAYYPEVIAANLKTDKDIPFIYDYAGVHRPRDFYKKIHGILGKYFDGISLKEVKEASDAAYSGYESFMDEIRRKGSEYLDEARRLGMPVVILAGRPYHIDGEVNHGIDQLICDLGAAVLSEDSVSHMVGDVTTDVLNQWTYHSRMYAGAKLIAESGDMDLNMVQLVSFGCGVDAVTSDEVRAILEDAGRIYTQVKIDEITNLGAVKIRIRSLFAAMRRLKEAK